MERNRRAEQTNKKKTAFFVISRIRYRTQFGLIFDETCDSEHPKTQQRDRKIGQTCEAKSEAQCEYRLYRWCCLQKGWKQESERSKKKEADFGEPLGSLGEPLGTLWGDLGRLWGDSGSLGGGFGETLGGFWEALGRLWNASGRLWGDFGRLWGDSGRLWEGFGETFGGCGETLGGFAETLGNL